MARGDRLHALVEAASATAIWKERYEYVGKVHGLHMYEMPGQFLGIDENNKAQLRSVFGEVNRSTRQLDYKCGLTTLFRSLRARQKHAVPLEHAHVDALRAYAVRPRSALL